ncbi:prolipoprotein diacylglyceryl transferase [Clostridium fermenticellae]|uniref:Phosphatidylglycerol--prolipoprotein diacylglyceryl transferase n=1 Tax=Clostridium fermenticellae TaxID=2068654 RepID=A0A386H4L3_9CLOT|nr:prolipoprotein diacylglyceryl transferase [Clostridium fermenticellae]AYD40473.1 prolipoprotein diacylglyceryl transferase [Clostridium fermenticellae]
MNPIAFSILGLDIRWYGIFIAAGILIGIFIAEYTCKVRNLSYDILLDIVLISLPISIIGARAYYVLFNLKDYDSLISAINIRRGGLAIHGGLLFGLTTALLYCKYRKINFLEYADTAAPSIILAQALGRWGNFFNGEAHGKIVSYNFISHFPAFIQHGMFIDGNYYNPTFLYESIWNILVFIILIQLIKKFKNRGLILFSYIGLYSIGRFFVEGMRTDSLLLGSIRMAQLVSFIGIIIWVIFLIYTYKKNGFQKNYRVYK